MNTRLQVASVLGLMACVALPARSQDSVAVTPGNSDALSAYATQRHRYVVDLAELTGSWGTPFFIGPVLKASASLDPLFPTQLGGATAVSADVLANVSFASVPYAVWNSAGAGLHPTENSAPGSIGVSGYDRQFGVALNDLSANATNILGALIGQDSDALDRLYVDRVVAMTSRLAAAPPDLSTISLGGVDATGNLFLRADSFNTSSTQKITGENIVRVDLGARGAFINALANLGSGNIATDASATAFLINNGTTTTNTPAAAPEAGANPPIGVILDFANKYRDDGAPGVTTHLHTDVSSHRGNPHVWQNTSGGTLNTVASLARSNAGGGKVDSINIFVLNTDGSVGSTQSVTLPSPITDGQGFSANAAGDAEFKQYLSQVSFRGPSGLAALGTNVHTGNMLAAAVATDPTQGEFVAVAEIVGGGEQWTVAAHVGSPVRNGASGATIGTIVAGTVATFSAPALDRLGNIYFVARYLPTGGSETSALIKAVNVGGASGYRLELLLKGGDSFVGPNSTRSYTIRRITLADSDSMASGTVHAASVLQPQIAGHETSDPTSAFAFGGIVVNAEIEYDNGGVPETYDAVLFVGPRAATPPACTGDIDGDQDVDSTDLNILLTDFGCPGPGCAGDADGDGDTDSTDLNIVLSVFGLPCE